MNMFKNIYQKQETNNMTLGDLEKEFVALSDKRFEKSKGNRDKLAEVKTMISEKRGLLPLLEDELEFDKVSEIEHQINVLERKENLLSKDANPAYLTEDEVDKYFKQIRKITIANNEPLINKAEEIVSELYSIVDKLNQNLTEAEDTRNLLYRESNRGHLKRDVIDPNAKEGIVYGYRLGVEKMRGSIKTYSN